MHAMVRLVDRFLVLDHGAVLVEGTPEAVTKDARVIEAYLGAKWSAPCLRSTASARAIRRSRCSSDVSINVGHGEFVSVVGPNGAGKTTLFKTISGVIKPTAGAIRFEGNDLLDVPPSRRAAPRHRPCAGRPARVPVDDGDGESRARRLYGRRRRSPGEQISSRSSSCSPFSPSAANNIAGTLSGGEQQMLAIGRGLASSPKLLMLDEPSMGLAPAIADFIFERLHRDPPPDRSSRSCSSSSALPKRLNPPTTAMCSKPAASCSRADNKTLRADDRVRAAYLGM